MVALFLITLSFAACGASGNEYKQNAFLSENVPISTPTPAPVITVPPTPKPIPSTPEPTVLNYFPCMEVIFSEPLCEASVVDAYADTINVRHLLSRQANEALHFFGNVTDTADTGMGIMYNFDTGVMIHLCCDAQQRSLIVSIWVGFNHADYRFHFDGLSLASAYDDVIAAFGGPGGIRQEYGNGGAAFSYVYIPTADGGWVTETSDWAGSGLRFYFTDEYKIVGIQWFLSA